MIRVIEGDCREVMATLPERSVQTCVTSPPYFNLRDYQVPGQIGLETTVDEYVDALVQVFRGVWRVLRDDGTLWLNLGDSYAGSWSGNSMRPNGGTQRPGKPGFNPLDERYAPRSGYTPEGLKPKDLIGVPWRVAFALQADGWYLRSDIIWAKLNPMPESVRDRPTKSHEYLFLLAKQPRYYYDAEAIAEPVTASTVARLSQPTLETQAGSERVPGKTNGPMKAVPPRFGGAKYGDSGEEQHRTKSGNAYALPNHGRRNARTVWTIATQPFSEAHFATFPPALVEPCIKAGTSERGCCPACGAPWVRVVERQRTFDGRPFDGGAFNSSTPHRIGPEGVGHYRFATETREAGWQPGCECSAGDPIPCTVLDPFSGSGTTGVVARRLGRSYLGIELNREYIEMSRRRIEEDAPMFNAVDVVPASCDTTDTDQSGSPDHLLPRQMTILGTA